MGRALLTVVDGFVGELRQKEMRRVMKRERVKTYEVINVKQADNQPDVLYYYASQEI